MDLPHNLYNQIWGSSIRMLSGRQRASTLFVVTLLGTLLFLATDTNAQTVLETPQQTNDRIRTLSVSSRAIPHDYVIGSGDLLQVEVFDVPELTREVRVSQTGTISLPLVPVRLRVAGLTEAQAQQKVAEVLESNGLVTHADVSIAVKDRKSKPITVVGAVTRPMVFQADRPVTLLEVLAEAGGITNDAGDTIIVTRPIPLPEESATTTDAPAIGPEDPAPVKAAQESASPASSSNPVSLTPGLNTFTVNLNDLLEAGDTKNNMLLQAGDAVTVPHAGIVYVLGAVTHPGGFVMSNDRTQLSAMKVLSLAGGLNRTAKSDRAVIVRKDNQGKQHEVSLDLKKVLKFESEDVQLQPSDVLYVPDSAAKQAFLRTVELGVALGSGIALYRLAYH